MAEYIDIVLSKPDPEKPDEIFVEIEAPFGRGVTIGESIKFRDFRKIRIKPEDIEKA